MFKRFLNLQSISKNRSLFLFGPRQTGKSTLLKIQFPNAFYVDLLEADTFRELSAHPEILRTQIEGQKQKIIVIDEIQKIPELLDEVHRLIERDKSRHFILTGSSARSLRKKGVNLLGGRALSRHLHPLVSWEVDFADLEESILWGSLPGILTSHLKKEDLKAYVGTYLQEEIRAEGLVRNLGNFARFLEVAALCSGKQLNYASIGSESMVNERTTKDYFQILADTFIGYELQPYRKTKTRKAVATPKFYLFDTGVWNALLGRFSISTKTREFGEALEHRVHHELKTYLDYHQSDESLSYWRPRKQDAEVDFLVGDRIGIEVKGTSRVSPRDTKGLLLLAEEANLEKKIIVCMERIPRKLESGIDILPYKAFCERLWSGELLG